jgi:CrcB protein
MIGLEGVAHAEQRSETGTGEEFENWHNVDGRWSFYVNLLVIAIGGALGSVARYLFSSWVLRVSGTLFPIGTFAVNVVGCAVFGAIAGAAEQRVPLSSDLRAFLLIGVLGGFTTFSSYAFESFSLLRDGQFLGAALNIAGQVVAGLVGLWAGYVITN